MKDSLRGPIDCVLSFNGTHFCFRKEDSPNLLFGWKDGRSTWMAYLRWVFLGYSFFNVLTVYSYEGEYFLIFVYQRGNIIARNPKNPFGKVDIGVLTILRLKKNHFWTF